METVAGVRGRGTAQRERRQEMAQGEPTRPELRCRRRSRGHNRSAPNPAGESTVASFAPPFIPDFCVSICVLCVDLARQGTYIFVHIAGAGGPTSRRHLRTGGGGSAGGIPSASRERIDSRVEEFSALPSVRWEGSRIAAGTCRLMEGGHGQPRTLAHPRKSERDLSIKPQEEGEATRAEAGGGYRNACPDSRCRRLVRRAPSSCHL
ncbi:hypothetical protein HPB51_021736 [Rhipicephalus microplus]|uniref:Uncharacterized protein n=1 Tax=Rhipicephalus microplus TaxID=6941 RepID=A0A9J6DPU6_RHIMP|nr:hypothetical protein HPB51_021736 [Rhipicephalus microplus]